MTDSTPCPKCRSGFTCAEHGGKDFDPNAPLPLIGYARVIVDKLTLAVHEQVQGYADFGDYHQTMRGNTFNVRLVDADGPTNFIARVTIELDHVENERP